MPTISVVIATWNRVHELQQCIKSVLSQDYPINQLIIIDNGSTDHTDIYCNEIVQDHCIQNDIDYVFRSVSCSALEALNIGYSLSTSDYIITVDDDAELLSHSTFTSLVHTLIDPSIYIAGCSVVPDKYIKITQISPTPVHSVLGSLFIMRNGPDSRYDPSLGIYGNELDLSVRMRIKGYKTVLLDGLYVYHPFRVSTFSDDREKQRIVNAFNILKYFNINYKIKMIWIYLIGCTWEIYALFSWRMMLWWAYTSIYVISKTLCTRSDILVDNQFQFEYYTVRKSIITSYIHRLLHN